MNKLVCLLGAHKYVVHKAIKEGIMIHVHEVCILCDRKVITPYPTEKEFIVSTPYKNTELLKKETPKICLPDEISYSTKVF